jgi:hypothetical protein
MKDCAPSAFSEASVMAAMQETSSIKSFTAKCGPPAWEHLPSWFLVSANDQTILPQAEEFFAKRMGATNTRGRRSHAAMIAHFPKMTAHSQRGRR